MAIDVVRRSPEEVAGESYTTASKAISQGAHGMELLALHIPYALGHNEDGYIAWRKRILPPDHKIVELDRFEDYLLKPVREGFGLPSLYFLDGAMKLLGQKGKPALAALRQEIPDWDERVEREAGQRLEVQETKQGQRTDITSTNCGSISSQSTRAESNGVHPNTQRKLDRLGKDRPDLLQRVRDGELSVHRAAVEAGIVKPPQTLEQAKRLWLKMGQEERFAFWRWAHEQ